jgi:GNAT superfamily N-acetyltransferase
MTPGLAIRPLAAAETDSRRAALAALLVDAIEGGASVGFLLPIDEAAIDAFWRDVVADLRAGARFLFAAEQDGHLVGTIQLAPSPKPNQAHRADVQKLLVARAARRQGIGRALIAAVESAALATGRWLLVLDTRTGSDAERLYRRLGWREVGRIPDYAADPDRALASCTFFYKRLVSRAPAGDG